MATATARVERRLAAIMAVDVVGYSRLIEQDEAGTLAAIRALWREVIDPLLAGHHGRIVKLMGDGAIVEFGSVVDAVASAVAVQKGAAAQQAEVPPERRIVFRIGVNLGDVVVEGEDLLGDGVNVAARLEQLCEPDGVLVSGTAYDHLQGKLDVPLEFAGERQLKNIDRPVRAYRVRLDGLRAASPPPQARRRWAMRIAAAVLLALLLATGAFWWFRPQEPVFAGHPSIAVLPFDNLGGDEATRRLADGITEDVITDLSRFREFDVIARNSTAVYKGRPVDVRQVGRELGVRYVLEGSIQRQGDQVRATAQLIDAGNGAHLWTERWDRPAGDVFAVQTEIAEQVAGQLGGGVVMGAERQAAQRRRPKDLTAYELYLRGLDELNGHTRETTDEAMRLLTQAVERDPNLARAWTALSAAHDYSVSFGADLHAAEAKATEAAERAIEIDPMDADAHRALAETLVTLGEFTRAQAEFETALRLNPGDAYILANYASWAGTLGHPKLGAEAADRAIRLDPNYAVGTANRFRSAYFSAERYEDALRMVERQPPESRTRWGWVQRAASYAALGRSEEARAAVAAALARHPELSIQGFLSTPETGEAERKRTAGLMREAGFPLCATPEQLMKFEQPFRLAGCPLPKTAN
ncbi:MAG TPA: tetratricopeptide repeat protein [Geminicoccaceae bacterium]|nr:tetratricopeptide repeat protein [Geminicoccaceae bacterium]